MSLIECVPNVSEGRRQTVIDTMVDTLRSVPGLRLLDYSADPTHHRSVFTMAGDAEVLRAAVISLMAYLIEAIDMRRHAGVHPRLGALDVVPFIPLEGTPMADCVALARAVGREIGTRFEVPVFLYEEAASHPLRRNLARIRRGQFEGLAEKMSHAEWAPDYGPLVPHPTAGATVVGARRTLIAYNINLASDRLDIARRIARAVRESGGGLPHVKALGLALEDRGVVQVSMNLTDYERTPIERVFDRVAEEAAREGAEILESEIVGLIPDAALAGTTATHLRLRGFSQERILENRLAATRRD